MPNVSVIIPTYNRSALLKQAIESVLAQTYRDFELVVVDDGSTDDTKSVVESIDDSRIHYIWQPNQQRCVARNTGIAEAQGQFIAFLDSDDLWLPKKLELQLAAAERHPGAGAVAGRCVRVGPNLEFMHPQELLPCDGDEWCGNLHKDLLICNIFASPTVMVRRELLDRVGGFDASLPHAEDWDMWIRVSAITDFCVVNEPVAVYRVHRGNRTSNPVSTQRGDQIILDKHAESLSVEMRQRAELASYATHSARAVEMSLPEASDWIAAALECAGSLRDGDAIRGAFVAYATAAECSLEDYRAAVDGLEASVRLVNSLGGSESRRAWLGSFWGTAIQAARGIGDNRLAAQALLHLVACGGITCVNRGVISSAVRALLALAMHPSAKRKPLLREQEITAFLEGFRAEGTLS